MGRTKWVDRRVNDKVLLDRVKKVNKTLLDTILKKKGKLNGNNH